MFNRVRNAFRKLFNSDGKELTSDAKLARQAIDELHLSTHERLAYLLGVSHSTVENWLYRGRNMSEENRQTIRRLLLEREPGEAPEQAMRRILAEREPEEPEPEEAPNIESPRLREMSGAELVKHAKRIGLKPGDIARALSVSYSAVYSWEAGNRRISETNRQGLIDFLSQETNKDKESKDEVNNSKSEVNNSKTDSFGTWLKSQRNAIGISQRALVERTGVSSQTRISRMERGDLEPSQVERDRIERFFRASDSEIKRYNEDPEQPISSPEQPTIDDPIEQLAHEQGASEDQVIKILSGLTGKAAPHIRRHTPDRNTIAKAEAILASWGSDWSEDSIYTRPIVLRALGNLCADVPYERVSEVVSMLSQEDWEEMLNQEDDITRLAKEALLKNYMQRRWAVRDGQSQN